MSGGENGCGKTMALLRGGVTVGSLELSDKAVSAEQTDMAAAPGGEHMATDWRSRGRHARDA